MKVYKIQPAGFASNTFAVTGDDKTCVLIDCSHPCVFSECESVGLTPEYVLLTHGHFDHIAGCAEAARRGAKICCGSGEDKLIFSEEYASIFGEPIEKFPIFRTLSDGETFSACGVDFRVTATPGHTVGSVCYIARDRIFAGDTLFYESVGRCDLPYGDGNALVASVKKLYELQGDYKIYCGHGGDTTLSHERAHNLFVRK